MMNSLEQFTYIYTTTPVTVNDSWENNYTGNLNSENTWTFLNVDKNSSSIEGSSIIAMNSKDDSMKMILDGTSNTSITCNKKNGVLKNMVVESTMEGTTTITQQNMEIPTTIISKTTYKALNDVQ